MIRLPEAELDPEAARQLEEWQTEIDAHATYPEQVEDAVRLFKSRNTIRNPTFVVVRETLTRLCSGARRCAYCEDSVADEIEHVKPKTLYPGEVFRWSNYIYACGPCNGPKNNRFFVFADSTGVLTDVTRSRNGAISSPTSGRMVLLHPRLEDGLDYLELDLSDTWLFNPRPDLSPRDVQRARTTIDLLGLNSRDYLPVARRDAYDDYLAHMEVYVNKKRGGASPIDLSRRIDNLKRRSHPTVWCEMKRQRTSFPILNEMFAAAPELLDLPAQARGRRGCLPTWLSRRE